MCIIPCILSICLYCHLEVCSCLDGYLGSAWRANQGASDPHAGTLVILLSFYCSKTPLNYKNILILIGGDCLNNRKYQRVSVGVASSTAYVIIITN